MPRYAALLRAINVGGRNVRKERLVEIFARADAANIATVLASGNVVFTSRARDAAALEARLETQLAQDLGFAVATFVRTPEQLRGVLAHEAFDARKLAASRALNVVFLKRPPDAAARAVLDALRSDVDDFHVHGREIWWRCAVRQSESTISNAVLEKKLGVTATIRGLGTLEKVVAKSG